MAEADLGDIFQRGREDTDVSNLLALLRKVLKKYGAFLTMRMVASVLAPYKRKRFEKQLKVLEYEDGELITDPATLVGEEPDLYSGRDSDMGLDHAILWQRQGEMVYLTAEPYYIKKDDLKALVDYCDRYGVDFQIDAESCYYPGHAIRVLFKKGHVSMYDALQQTSGERR